LLLGLSLVDLDNVSHLPDVVCGRRTTYMLDECALVLEGVTLAELIELVVEMFVDFSSSTVLDKKASQDSEASHP